MMNLKDFSPGDPATADFVKFGRSHKQKFPYIVTPFRGEEERQLDPKLNPFFEKGQMRCWLAEQESKIKGRLAAMINPSISFDGGKLGLIGFFDVVEDKATAFSLLDAAIEWLHMNGCTHCWAPVNFSIWHSYRFAVDHFEEPPFVGEPKNPPWYPDFVEQYGFQSKMHWDSWWVEKEGMDQVIERFAGHYNLFEKCGYAHEPLDPKNVEPFLKSVHSLAMEAFTRFPGFSKISYSVFRDLYESMTKVLDSDCTLFVNSPSKEKEGFLLCQRDLGEAIAAMNGRKNLLSIARFILSSRKKEYINLSHGILHQKAKDEANQRSMELFNQRMSPSLATVHRSLELARRKGYKGFLFSMMLPDAPTRNFIEDQVSKQRRHRLYQKEI